MELQVKSGESFKKDNKVYCEKYSNIATQRNLGTEFRGTAVEDAKDGKVTVKECPEYVKKMKASEEEQKALSKSIPMKKAWTTCDHEIEIEGDTVELGAGEKCPICEEESKEKK